MNKRIIDVINEYGMTTGPATPVSQQKTGGIVNKSDSNTKQTGDDQETSMVTQKADQFKKDAEFPDKKGNRVTVVSPVGEKDPSIPDDAEEVLIVQSNTSKKFYAYNPEKELLVPVNESRLDEINVNKGDVIRDAMSAPIQCGFEAEIIWTKPVEELLDMKLERANWDKVSEILPEGGHKKVMASWVKWIESLDEYFTTYIDIQNELYSSIAKAPSTLISFAKHMIETNPKFKEEATRIVGADGVDVSDIIGVKHLISTDNSYKNDLHDFISDQVTKKAREETLYNFIESKPYNIDSWVATEYGDYFGMLVSIYGNKQAKEIVNNLPTPWVGYKPVVADFENWVANNSEFNEVRVADRALAGKQVDEGQDFWRIENDGTINAPEGMASAEIVSPVYDTPGQMMREMANLFRFFQENGVITNKSTGLHITMSLTDVVTQAPNMLKVALLYDDNSVLKLFDRLDSAFSSSYLDLFADMISSDHDGESSTLRKKQFKSIERKLNDIMTRLGTKTMSTYLRNVQNSSGNQLVEFRAIGGDDYHKRLDDIGKTVAKYATSLNAAYNDEAYRKEYLKKLHKLIVNTEIKEALQFSRNIVSENAVPDISVPTELQRLMSVPLLSCDRASQMDAFLALPVPSMINEFKQHIAMYGPGSDMREILKRYMDEYLHPARKEQIGMENNEQELLQIYNDQRTNGS